jgi:hypothetical protein
MIMAQGTPEEVFAPETLNATFRGDMLVVRQHGLIFVQERPHGHSYHDINPRPVLSHPSHLAEDTDDAADVANTAEDEEPAHGRVVNAL